MKHRKRRNSILALRVGGILLEKVYENIKEVIWLFKDNLSERTTIVPTLEDGSISGILINKSKVHLGMFVY